MKIVIIAALTFCAAACGQETSGGAPAAPNGLENDEAAVSAASAEALERMRAQFVVVEMDADTSFLSDEQIAVLNKLNDVGDVMSDIYLLQRSPDNPAWRDAIAGSGLDRTDRLLEMFDLHFGPWDTLNANKPFFGEQVLAPGAGFYPADMTRAEFEAWIAAHPEDEDAFRSGYTVIRRDADRLIAIPYSVYYRPQLERAAALMRDAARLTSNERLKRFLTSRADAFLTNDYFESEVAWMDLQGPIEATIGPYDVYTDKLFGYKTTFQASITVIDHQESAALAKHKSILRNLEANLPVAERYKNFDRNFRSPVFVAYQVHGGGDNAPGVQTIAFDLPNDNRVRNAKGAKKVILNNILNAKFDRILAPMAADILVADQARLLMKEYMSQQTLFHEFAHSLGPSLITKNGRETSVSAELKELYSAVEEGKADVMGAYNVLHMMERGALPIAEKENFLATYAVGLFRSMRFGVDAAHGKGAAVQYSYFRQAGAFMWDADENRYRLNFVTLEQAISDLTRDIVVLQGEGDYDAAKAFLDRYARLDAEARRVIAALTRLPVDIQPIYKGTL